MKKRVLVSIAHPDDEVLGCGGTIAKHISQGDEVFCICMTDGVGARILKKKSKDVNERKKSALAASKKLGFRWLHDYCANFPDNGLDSIKLLEIIRVIEKAKVKVNPHIVYTHDSNDLNIDHKLVSDATMTAFRPQEGEICESIIAIEIPSASDYGSYKNSLNFNPNYYVDISKTWTKKFNALKCYGKEMKKYPNSRSIKGLKILAEYRGTQVGIKKAEAFKILRQINRK
tara:strand:- start:17324 stop:18013 length:690 start_codon:yes stop_codon:yes gene_type:complete